MKNLNVERGINVSYTKERHDIMFKKKPEDVFVIRTSTVNEKLYVKREGLEKELKRLIKTAPNIMIRGESGCGKTWLYKNVFDKEGINYEVIDLSKAIKEGMTIEKVIKDKLNKNKEFIQTGYATEKNAGIKIPVAEGAMSYSEEFTRNETALLEMYENLHHKGSKSLLVLDNLEQIKDNQQLLDELNSMIMNVDNEDFAEFNVKLLIVGTPSGFKHFRSKAKNIDTLTNRLKSLEEVKGLTLKETGTYFQKSMINIMNIKFDESDVDKYIKHIFSITNGIPQRIVEYCLNLCYTIEDEGGVTEYKKVYKAADLRYLKGTLDKSVEVISRKLNSNETSLQRRNQVLYTLGKMKVNTFKTADVEKGLRKIFEIPQDSNVNVSSLLAELSYGDDPILIKTNDTWMFQDSQYLVTLKLMLSKRGQKVISKM